MLELHMEEVKGLPNQAKLNEVLMKEL